MKCVASPSCAADWNFASYGDFDHRQLLLVGCLDGAVSLRTLLLQSAQSATFGAGPTMPTLAGRISTLDWPLNFEPRVARAWLPNYLAETKAKHQISSVDVSHAKAQLLGARPVAACLARRGTVPVCGLSWATPMMVAAPCNRLACQTHLLPLLSRSSQVAI